MSRLWFAVVVGWLFLLVGCSEQTQHGEASDAKQTLVGEAFYRERILLPPGAHLHLSLEDVSKMDVPSTVLATSTQPLTGAPPYAISLDYSAEDIDSRMQYSLRATIMLDGKLLFTSMERLDPFKQPEDAIVIQLNRVDSTKDQQQAAQPSEADSGLAVVSVNPLAELTNTYWKLVSLNGANVVMAEGQEREAFLQLRNDDNSARGFAGCNRFTGSYTVNGNDLSFGPLAATRKACLAGMETEAEFLQVLDGAAYFSIHEETLILLSERKKPVARFIAVYFD
jgi:putative lipoprotein